MKIIRNEKDLITQIVRESKDDLNVDVTQLLITNEKEYTQRCVNQQNAKKEKFVNTVREISSCIRYYDEDHLPPYDEMNLDFSEAGQEQ